MDNHPNGRNGSRRRRNSIAGQWIARTISMLDSPAYRALSLSAHRALSRIEIEHMHHGGADNGKLPVTYVDFISYGIHRRFIAPAIRELVALGFIEITEQGVAGNAEFRRPSLYRLTYRPAYNAGKHDGNGTHEWQRIETMEQAEALANQARRNVDVTAVRRAKNRISVHQRCTGFGAPKVN
jgi:hypothetical protein